MQNVSAGLRRRTLYTNVSAGLRRHSTQREELRRGNPKVASKIAARKRRNGNKIRGSKPGKIMYVRLVEKTFYTLHVSLWDPLHLAHFAGLPCTRFTARKRASSKTNALSLPCSQGGTYYIPALVLTACPYSK